MPEVRRIRSSEAVSARTSSAGAASSAATTSWCSVSCDGGGTGDLDQRAAEGAREPDGLADREAVFAIVQRGQRHHGPEVGAHGERRERALGGV